MVIGFTVLLLIVQAISDYFAVDLTVLYQYRSEDTMNVFTELLLIVQVGLDCFLLSWLYCTSIDLKIPETRNISLSLYHRLDRTNIHV
jgi:hypothetical protein